MNILYRDFGAARYRSTSERLNNPVGLSPHSQIFAPLDTLTPETAERRYQSTPENGLTTNWYVKLNIDSVRDKKAWADIVVPAGEQLCLFKHLPGYNRLLDVGVLVDCGSHAMATDIDIVKVSDPDTSIFSVAAGVDLTVCDDFAADIPPNGEGDAGAAVIGDYIKREDSYLLRVCITPPFTDADGNGVFVSEAGTPCEEASCLRLLVHAHLRNMCFSDVIRGCRLEDGCCDEAPDAPADCTTP